MTKESIKEHLEYLRGKKLPEITIVETKELGQCADCGADTHFLVLEKKQEICLYGVYETAWYCCGVCAVGG